MPDMLFNKAINAAIHEEMSRDEKVFLIGNNVARCPFGTSDGLYETFGLDRVRSTGISEAAIMGSAVGAAIFGYRPIVNIMFCDFLVDCADELLFKAATWRYETGGKVTIPLVVRAPMGGYTMVGAQHSHCMEAMVWHTPGLKIAVPSSPYDAKGLLKTAIRDNNPVVFFEHKVLYGSKGQVPLEEYTLPFGMADIKREGTDVTVIAVGYQVVIALQVADVLQNDFGISLEVIDPRTLEPLDLQTICSSVKKTQHVVIVDEDIMRCGVTGEIGMLIIENVFDYLDAPIKRVAALNYPTPHGTLEKNCLPQPQWIADAVGEVLGVDHLNLEGKVKVASWR